MAAIPGMSASRPRSHGAAEPRGGRDHYEVLGVRRGADDAEIRAAFRRLALLTHPDKGGSEAAFKQVNAAFDALSSSPKRRSYEEERRSVAASGSAGSGDVGRKRPRAPAASRRDRALARLEALVSRIPREERQPTLAGLPRKVAQELLAFMEAKKRGCASTAGHFCAASTTASAGTTSAKVSPSGPAADAAEQHSRSGDSTDSESEAGEAKASSLQLALRPEYTERRAPGGGSGAHHGIKRAGGESQLYMVTVCCLNLLITSRPVPLDVALQFRMALALVKDALTVDPALEFRRADDLTQRFAIIMQSACSAVGVALEDLRPSLTPWVSARQEIGQKIYGQRTDDVRAAFGQRAELVAAKERGWSDLRAVWIQQLSATRTFADAAAMADAAWAAHAPARERQSKRRRLAPKIGGAAIATYAAGDLKDWALADGGLAAAVAEAEKAISAESRRAAAETGAEDQRRRPAPQQPRVSVGQSPATSATSRERGSGAGTAAGGVKARAGRIHVQQPAT